MVNTVGPNGWLFPVNGKEHLSNTVYYTVPTAQGQDPHAVILKTPEAERLPRHHRRLAASHCSITIDDYNREGLCIDADFRLPTLRVIRLLEQVIDWLKSNCAFSSVAMRPVALATLPVNV